jgi:hypothetical protein
MSLALHPASKPRKLRAAAPRVGGAASSLLRLARSQAGLPSGAALAGWMTRAGSLLDADVVHAHQTVALASCEPVLR